MQQSALTHAIELIRRASVTPEDGGCQDYLERVLSPLGFRRTQVNRGGVSNSVYARDGEQPGVLAFAGHTDVVPPGPLADWPHPPFQACVENGILHGRGAQDMKSAVACWLAAVERLVDAGNELPALQLLITSDEEGDSIDGTVRLVEHLQARNQLPDAVIVGEPSSSTRVGDTIRRGRRGVAHLYLTLKGKQGHSAYPQDAVNAIHDAIPIMARIMAIDWGEPAEGFPPTSCQFTRLQCGEGASNVIPGICTTFADIRYNPALDFEGVAARIREACGDGPGVKLDIRSEACAFKTADGPFLDMVSDEIKQVTGREAVRDTGGGTSDGRFLSAAGVPVVELGLTNDTIHQVGERVDVRELETLSQIYLQIIKHFEV